MQESPSAEEHHSLLPLDTLPRVTELPAYASLGIMMLRTMDAIEGDSFEDRRRGGQQRQEETLPRDSLMLVSEESNLKCSPLKKTIEGSSNARTWVARSQIRGLLG